MDLLLHQLKHVFNLCKIKLSSYSLSTVYHFIMTVYLVERTLINVKVLRLSMLSKSKSSILTSLKNLLFFFTKYYAMFIQVNVMYHASNVLCR